MEGGTRGVAHMVLPKALEGWKIWQSVDWASWTGMVPWVCNYCFAVRKRAIRCSFSGILLVRDLFNGDKVLSAQFNYCGWPARGSTEKL